MCCERTARREPLSSHNFYITYFLKASRLAMLALSQVVSAPYFECSELVQCCNMWCLHVRRERERHLSSLLRHTLGACRTLDRHLCFLHRP
jgi:hypothetical protein